MGSYQEELRARTLARMAEQGTDLIPVYQGDELVGHMHVLGRQIRSSSPMYDVRSGDFSDGVAYGKPCIIASPTLGSGDLACVQGFRPLRRVKPLSPIEAITDQREDS